MEKLKFKCEKIDESLIHMPFSLADADEWVLQIYKQFGFNTIEEIKAFAKKYEKYDWMNFFYWSKEVEMNFVKVILSYYPNLRKRNQVTEYLKEASINWSPTNELVAFERNHSQVKLEEEEKNGS
jgi:hypothetical protein